MGKTQWCSDCGKRARWSACVRVVDPVTNKYANLLRYFCDKHVSILAQYIAMRLEMFNIEAEKAECRLELQDRE